MQLQPADYWRLRLLHTELACAKLQAAQVVREAQGRLDTFRGDLVSRYPTYDPARAYVGHDDLLTLVPQGGG